MKQALFFLLWVISTHLSAQETGYLPGYIVTNENDTIHGLVKNKNSTPYRILQDIKFKRSDESEVEIYPPKTLKSFQAGTNRYVSKQVRENDSYTTSFWEVLTEGDLSSYELRITGLGTGNEVVYAALQRKNEDFLFSVYGKDFRERLAAYFQDEPILYEKIRDGKYNRSNLDELVAEYNLLKYTPLPSKTSRKRTINFYKRATGTKADLYLIVNDTLEYRVNDKYFTTVAIPVDVRSKVCFGVKENKSCELIPASSYYTLPEYYELLTGGSRLKFDIEKRTKTQAQLHIHQP